MPELEVRVREVKALRTQSGNTRFVLVDDDGREYTTFREEIAARLQGLEGRRVRIAYHEQRRGTYTNVYLDGVEPLDEAAPAGPDADEAGWRTALEAAPYLLSADAVEEEVPPEELFEKLQPFKEMVARDIAGEDDDDDARD